MDYWRASSKKAYNHILTWKELIPRYLWNLQLTRNNNLFNPKMECSTSHGVPSPCKRSHFKPGPFNPHPNPSLMGTPPPRGTYKLNIDSSANAKPSLKGLKSAFRDHLGSYKLGCQEHTPHTNPLMAKILALWRGLFLPKAHGFKPFQIDRLQSHNWHAYI